MRRPLCLLLLLVAGCDCGGGEGINRALSDLQYDPPALDFGDVSLGATRVLSVTFSNKGATVVNFSEVSIDGDGNVFSLASTMPTALAPSESIDISVTFSPQAAGPVTGTLKVTADDKADARQIPLTGNGVTPHVDVVITGAHCGADMSSLAFGRTPVGQPVDQMITLKSSGTASVTIGMISFESDANEFSVVTPPTGMTVGPGGMVTLTVRYLPLDIGMDSSTLVIGTSAMGPPIRVPVCGEGTQPAICAMPVPLDIGPVVQGMMGSGTLHVKNCGSQPLPIGGVAITSDMAHPTSPGFTLATTTWPMNTNPNDTFDLVVNYAPPALGPAAGYIRIDTDASHQPSYFPIQATGVEACDLTVLPLHLDYYNVAVGGGADQRVLVSNDGANACSIVSLRMTMGGNVFTLIAPPGLPSVLQPGASTTLTVHYAPTVAGTPDHGMLEIGGGRSVRQVTLNGNSPLGPGCHLQANPAFLSFGVVGVGMPLVKTFALINVSSSDTCHISGAMLDAASSPGFTAGGVPATLGPGASAMVNVTYQPPAAGQGHGTLHVRSDDPMSPTDVPLFSATPPPGICVVPTHLSFGSVMGSRDLSFTISACGGRMVTVNALPFSTPDTQFTLVNPPALPLPLAAGAMQVVTVRYTPRMLSTGGMAVIDVDSNDPATPVIHVMLDGGQAIVPPAAGHFLYYWTVATGASGGDIVKLPLQGATTPTPYWGPRTGKNCSGCHALSNDGKYLALTDYDNNTGASTIKVVDTATNLQLPISLAAQTAFMISWRPASNTTPPYQFAYDDGSVIKIASISGDIRTLAGADDPSHAQKMPAWGPNGKIVFVKGDTDGLAPGGFGFRGNADIYIVDENGGAAMPLAGASNNGKLNYYPSFSPDGRWVAFTLADGGFFSATYANTGASIRLASADNSGNVKALTTANGAAMSGVGTSFPTWSNDGTLLSFSSNRPGGAGDWDIWYVPINSMTGVESGPPVNLTQANTPGFDHVARWSP